MLYEVITGEEHRRALHPRDLRGDAVEEQIDREGVGGALIEKQLATTLPGGEEYEDHQRDREREPAAVQDLAGVGEDRITSYNVCYTKLLRCQASYDNF